MEKKIQIFIKYFTYSTDLRLEAVLLVDRVLDLLLQTVGQVHVVGAARRPAVARLVVAVGGGPFVSGIDAISEAEKI